jgi:hypothetical protein
MPASRPFRWQVIPSAFLIGCGGLMGSASILMCLIAIFASGMPYVAVEAGYAVLFAFGGVMAGAVCIAAGHLILRRSGR